jgi:hypothetical protein
LKREIDAFRDGLRTLGQIEGAIFSLSIGSRMAISTG